MANCGYGGSIILYREVPPTPTHSPAYYVDNLYYKLHPFSCNAAGKTTPIANHIYSTA